jgi:hypothetical protein
MLVGIVIVSSGLVLLYGLSESNRGMVMNPIQQKWKGSYDILVRPPGSKLTDSQNQLIEPNIQSGITGGITMQQWEQIKKLPGVDIAAPISVIGYMNLNLSFPEKATVEESGVYRLTETVKANNGIWDEISQHRNFNFVNGPWKLPRTGPLDMAVYKQYGIVEYSGSLDTDDPFLLVGIDPEEEAKLVGLDQSVLASSDSRYFSSLDVSHTRKSDFADLVDLPILMSNQIFADKSYEFRFEKLDLPFDNAEQANKSMELVKANDGEAFLEKAKSESEKTYIFHSDQVQKILLSNRNSAISGSNNWIVKQKATPLTFDSINSQYSERWPYTYKVQSIPMPNSDLSERFPESYRPYEEYNHILVPNNYQIVPKEAKLMNGYALSPHFIGVYDPTKLKVTKDPLSELPMDTYRPPSARLLFDDANHPLNPPGTLKPINNPLGLLTSPPSLLTTVDAAANIIKDAPISVIRIKVNSVSEVSDENQKKLEQVTQSIKEQTGLEADILFGSAPQPVLINVPQSGLQPALGWVEQQWIKLGSKFVMVHEMKVGFSGMLLLVMLVAIIYVIATNLVTFLVRKKQYALMLSIGWRRSHIIRLIGIEGLLIGGFVALLTWALEGALVYIDKSQLSLFRFAMIGFTGFVIYLLGTISTVFFVQGIMPNDALRSGETVVYARLFTRVRDELQMAIGHFMGKIKRNMLSILSISMPTALLMFFLFITFRLKGVFYTTWIGQYAVAEIGSSHYLAIFICLLISVLTTAEIIWQNVSERKQEISLLRAIGWRHHAIRKLIMSEGLLIGCLASVLALLIALLVIQALYREMPIHDIWYLLLLCGVPILAGIMGSIIPAEMAVRMNTLKGMTGTFSTKSKTEKRLRWLLLGTIGIVTLISVSSIIRMIVYHNPILASSEVLASQGTKPSELPLREMGDLADFTPITVVQGSKAAYDLTLRMNETGDFSTSANITATNVSSENWDKLVLYMIPNFFTDSTNKQVFSDSAKLEIKGIRLNGQSTSYNLDGDTLTILLSQKLLPNGKATIEMNYDFSVPENGIRFSKQGNTYLLAQWYPMLATYNHGWDKEPYTPISESYHTDFSNFNLHYQLPEGFKIITSSENDPLGPSGQLSMENVKELFVAITKDMTFVSKQVDGIEIRAWGDSKDKKRLNDAIDIAANAFEFFNRYIAHYPQKQFDLIVGETSSMEYPGVITVGLTDDKLGLKHSIIHEIAHQWFYGVVSNDPYHDGWLDEGISELATSLYLDDFSYAEKFYGSNDKASNLPLSTYRGTDIINSLYAQPVLKYKTLIDNLIGREQGIKFLQSYWLNYQYKQVNTKEFVRFTKAYFAMKDDTFFKDWLSLNE